MVPGGQFENPEVKVWPRQIRSGKGDGTVDRSNVSARARPGQRLQPSQILVEGLTRFRRRTPVDVLNDGRERGGIERLAAKKCAHEKRVRLRFACECGLPIDEGRDGLALISESEQQRPSKHHRLRERGSRRRCAPAQLSCGDVHCAEGALQLPSSSKTTRIGKSQPWRQQAYHQREHVSAMLLVNSARDHAPTEARIVSRSRAGFVGKIRRNGLAWTGVVGDAPGRRMDGDSEMTLAAKSVPSAKSEAYFVRMKGSS